MKVRGARLVRHIQTGMHAEEAVPGEALRLYPGQASATIVLGFDNERGTRYSERHYAH
jgi:hypothetical protein